MQHSVWSRQALGAAFFCLVAVGPSVAQTTFVESASSCGIGSFHMALGSGPIGGVVAADYDDDGDVDLFVPNSKDHASQLYRNEGDGTFVDMAVELGVDSPGTNDRAALWVDVDGDHDLDLIVGSDCRTQAPVLDPCPFDIGLRTYLQAGDGSFEEVSDTSGVTLAVGVDGLHTRQHRSGLVAGDVDMDGYLDILATTWNGRAVLYRNDRDGTFTDISAAVGLTPELYYQMPVLADLNQDGWLDIYLAVDGGVPNQLLLNHGIGANGIPQLIDVAREAGVDFAFNDMGVALSDFDNDGRIDIYVTNIATDENQTPKHNVLCRNRSVGWLPRFEEISMAAGVDQGYWGWGTTWIDADNDGDVDLAATNGKDQPRWADDPARFWENPGAEPYVFVDRATEVGYSHPRIGSGLITFDFDRDGDLDLIETSVNDLSTGEGQVSIYVNATPTHDNWLVVRPRMAGPNHRAIGSIVTARLADGTRMSRVITAGTSTLGQEPAEAFFGLGSTTSVARVEVRFPNGARRHLENVEGRQVVTLDCDSTHVDDSLRVRREDDGVAFRWSPSCRGDEDAYRLVAGTLGDWNGPTELIAVGDGRLEWADLPDGNRFFLVESVRSDCTVSPANPNGECGDEPRGKRRGRR